MLCDDLLCDQLLRDLLAVLIQKIFDIDLLAPSAALRRHFRPFCLVVWARGQIVGPPILDMSVHWSSG